MLTRTRRAWEYGGQAQQRERVNVKKSPLYWSRFATATTVVLGLKYGRAEDNLRRQA